MALKKEAVPAKTKFDLIEEEFNGLKVEAVKVYEKGNKAAGARFRKHLSNIKKLATEARAESLALVAAP